MAKSPWLETASSGATGKTYEIRNVADFLLVPEERRRICLREFHSWLSIQKSVTDLLWLTEKEGRWRNEVFAWIDDGEGLIAVEIVEADAIPDHVKLTKGGLEIAEGQK